MKPKYFLILLFLFSLCIEHLTLNITHATVRFVSKSGSSTPPYTSWATASDSIQKCINISQSGDTIYVGNGVYKETAVMIRGLALIGSGVDSCIIDTRSFTPEVIVVTVRDSCLIKNFKIIVSNYNSPAYQWRGYGIYIADNQLPDHSTIIENNIIENARRGILSSTSNSTIQFNIIRNTNRGVILEGVTNNVYSKVINNQITSIEVCVWISFGSTPYIANNICIVKNIEGILGKGGFWGSYSGLNELYNNLFIIYNGSGAELSDSTYFYNNIITNNPVLGVLVGGNNQVLKNNVIENAEKALSTNIPSSQPTVVYNDFWNSGIIYHNMPPGDSTNISVDPMFVNDTSDFHLQMYSKLIDAGDPNILDKDGSRSDIGLFGGPNGEKYTYRDLAPRPPANLTAIYDSGFVKLMWKKNTEADFKHYRVYRDTTADFMYDTTKIVGVTADSFYYDDLPEKYLAKNYYYKITALDNTGNQSAPSEEITVNITGAAEAPPIVVEEYKLLNNYPNPFNSSTIIPYRLKAPGYVKLYIYDIKGELLKVLVNENQDAGYYEVRFSPNREERIRSGFGGNWQTGYNDDIATGIYLYQIMVRGEGDIPVFTEMGKMILLK